MVGAAAGAGAMICVGGSVAVSAVLAGAPVFTAEALRYAMACLILLVLARLTGRRLVRPRGEEWLWLVGIAVTGLVLFNVALVAGSRHAEPAVLGVGVACVPSLLAVIGPVLEGSRPRRVLVTAALVVTCGAALVQGVGRTDGVGVAWAVVVFGCEAAFTLLAIPVLGRHGPWGVSVHATWLAAVIFGAIGLVREGPTATARLGHQDWLAIGYLGVAVTAVAFVLWPEGAARARPDRAARARPEDKLRCIQPGGFVHFQHAGDIWRDFPQLVPAALYVQGITAEAESGPAADRFAVIAKSRLAAVGAEGEMPEIQAWRRAFATMGLKPTQYRCASESLLRRFRKEGSLPGLHPLVDLCNAVSLAYAIPVAVFDVSAISGPLEVRYAAGDEDYLTFAGEVEHPAAGEVIFADLAGQAHARRWTNRQSGRSAVRHSTASALIVAEALHDQAPRDIAELTAALVAELEAVWSVTPSVQVLTAASPRFALQPLREGRERQTAGPGQVLVFGRSVLARHRRAAQPPRLTYARPPSPRPDPRPRSAIPAVPWASWPARSGPAATPSRRPSRWQAAGWSRG